MARVLSIPYLREGAERHLLDPTSLTVSRKNCVPHIKANLSQRTGSYIHALSTFCLFASFLVIGSFNYGSLAEDHKAEKPPNSAMKTQYLEATVAFVQPPSPSNCSVTITVNNTSSEPLKMADYLNGLYRCTISITSPDGKPLPYTDRGTWGFGPDSEEGSTLIKRIAPGSQFTFRVPLEKFFRLTPGKFVLKCKIRVESEDADRSVDVPEMSFTLSSGREN